jgi:UDP-N-acetylglucosamine 2-epimerase
LATLVGTEENVILEALGRALNKDAKQQGGRSFVYGDGFSADRIAEIIKAVRVQEPTKRKEAGGYQRKGYEYEENISR